MVFKIIMRNLKIMSTFTSKKMKLGLQNVMFPAQRSSGSWSVPEPSRAAVGNKTLRIGELAQPSEQCASYLSQLALSLLWTVHLIDNSANQHATFSVILFTLSQNYTAGWKQILEAVRCSRAWLAPELFCCCQPPWQSWMPSMPPPTKCQHFSSYWKVTRFRN